MGNVTKYIETMNVQKIENKLTNNCKWEYHKFQKNFMQKQLFKQVLKKKTV